mmetsp:Transcript_8868/g.26400  ORF Transcript_8868/g.26400 Transcript_8868/m.26400 type:complete len:368 (-) Transcript_8868:1269-2372(-)
MSYSNWPTARPAPQSRSRSRSASNASAASAMSPSRKRAPASVAERATRSDSTDTGCGGAPAAPLAAVRPAKVSCSAQRIVSSPSDAITASRKSRTCQSACTTTLRKQLNSPRGLRIPAAPPLPRSCSRITLASETGCGRAALGFGSSDASAPGAPPQPFALGRLDDIVKGSTAPARPSAVCQRCCCSSTYRPSCLTSPVSASASPISPCRTRATMCSTTVRTCPSSTRGFGFTTVTSSSRAKDTSACVETFVSDVISSSRIVSSNSCRSKSTACCRSSSALKGVKSASPPLLPASALTGCEVGKNAAYRSTAAVPSLSALQTTRAHACAPCSSSCANRSMRGPGSAAAGGAAPSAASSPAALALVSV